jgi:murein DD-endopeptidase MepM/ murein hydrolase activator NlpD
MTAGQPDPAAGRKKCKAVRTAVFGLAALAALAALVFVGIDLIRGSRPAPAPVAAEEAAPALPASPPPLVEHKIALRSGDNIGDVLSRHGFSPTQVDSLWRETRSVYDLRRIHAGQELRLFAGIDGRIERLEYDISEVDYLAVRRENGRFEAELKHRPVEIRFKQIWGSIEESLILSFNALGEEDPLALAFSEIFGWDVDFYIDLQPGDTFKVIFEKRYIEGRFAGDGNILAAELVNAGKVHRAFYFEPPDTKRPGYYNEAGASMEKEFRRSPIKWARITSRFSSRRMHPIRGVYTTHYGVDYAAPAGTQIQATADGVVISAGWNGGAGRMVRIRHKNNYETMYLHLQGFAAGIRRGTRVKGGDVIGYVGSTGESTGPHVDYRILRGGGYLNPLSAKFAPVEPLQPELVEDYKKSVERYRLLLDDPLFLIRNVVVR